MSPRALRKANLVLAAVVVAVGVSAAGVALTKGPSRGAAAARHADVHPATRAAGSSTTTVTTAPPTSTTSAPVSVQSTSSATTPPSLPAATPTTTAPSGPPPCRWSSFGVKVTSSSTANGEATITAVAVNDGPPCTDSGQAHCLCWDAIATPVSPGSSPIWDLADTANPPVSGDGVSSPLPVLPTGWSTQPQQMTWDETQCTTANCPPKPAPHGQYDLVAVWAYKIGGAPVIESDPVSVTVPS